MKAFQLQPFFLKNSLKDFLNWKFIGYLVLFNLISVLISLISVLVYTTGTAGIFMDVLQLVGFIILGLVHNRLLRKLTAFTHFSPKEKFYSTFVLSLAIYGSLLLVYYSFHSQNQQIAVASSAAFLLPYTIIQAWNYFLLIPANSSCVWKGYHVSNENLDLVFLNTILINFRLAGKHQDKEETLYLISTPFNLELGKVFNSFLNREINNGNYGIECINRDNQPYAWQFYQQKFGGLYKRLLDPAKTLYDNGNIKKNATLIAKRIDLT